MVGETGYMISVTGPGCILVFPILATMLIPVGLVFAELSAMLPFSSAVDVWTTNAFGPKVGWAAQWLMFLIQVVGTTDDGFHIHDSYRIFHPYSAKHGSVGRDSICSSLVCIV